MNFSGIQRPCMKHAGTFPFRPEKKSHPIRYNPDAWAGEQRYTQEQCSFPETRVGASIELHPRDCHVKQSRYIIEPSKYITGLLRVHFYSQGFLRSPPLYVHRGRLRCYIDRKRGVQCTRTREHRTGESPIVLNVHADTARTSGHDL